MRRFWHDLFGHTSVHYLRGKKAFCGDCGSYFRAGR